LIIVFILLNFDPRQSYLEFIGKVSINLV